MRCWSCEFENLPGLGSCARCGSSLELAQVAIEPPRASPLRLVTRAGRAGRRVFARTPDFRAIWQALRHITPEPISGSALAWSIIPGLGHRFTGRRRLGRILLPIWCGLLALAILSLGGRLAWWFLSLAIATHAVAILSLFAANLAYERLLLRLAFGAVVYIGLRLLLYQPILWFGGRFLDLLPLNNITAGPMIAEGDWAFFAGPWLRPESFDRGDLVVYVVGADESGGVRIAPGYGFDRIVGVPGDLVQIRDGQLLVNNAQPPPTQGPLGVVPAGLWLELHLGPEEYAILPSRLRLRTYGEPRDRQSLVHSAFCQLTRVPAERIEGRALLRIRPLSRFGRFK
jgi:hypothetical protein